MSAGGKWEGLPEGALQSGVPFSCRKTLCEALASAADMAHVSARVCEWRCCSNTRK